jgi:ferredoxin-thioredoxin reductase catalytic subunit
MTSARSVKQATIARLRHHKVNQIVFISSVLVDHRYRYGYDACTCRTTMIVHQLDPENILVLDTPVDRSFWHKAKDKYM